MLNGLSLSNILMWLILSQLFKMLPFCLKIRFSIWGSHLQGCVFENLENLTLAFTTIMYHVFYLFRYKVNTGIYGKEWSKMQIIIFFPVCMCFHLMELVT